MVDGRLRKMCVVDVLMRGPRGQLARGMGVFGVLLVLAACSGPARKDAKHGFSPSEYGVSASERVVQPGQPVPRGGGVYRVGSAYKVRGKTYQPRFDPTHDEVGVASWYGDDFHGRRTANGEIYDMHAFSAAHRTLPLPSYVRVTNVANGRSVIVRVNDRGPFHSNRVIDMSRRASEILAFHGHGVARVRVTYVGAAPLDGNDDWLVTTVKANGVPVPPQEVARLAPIPDWAVHRPAQKSAVQLALADTLAPAPRPRPREELVQLASQSSFLPASVRQTPAPSTPSASAQTASAPIPPTPVTPIPSASAPVALTPVALAPLPAARPDFAKTGQGAPSAPAAPVQALAHAPPANTAGSNLVLSLNAGSFRDPSEAFRIRDALSRHGRAVVDPVNVSGITFYQVRLAPIFGQAAADTALKDAKAQGAVSARILPL